MAVVGVVAAVVGAGTAVYSATEQRAAGKQAANAQRKQIDMQKQQAEMQNVQSAREMARGRYRAQARILNVGALTNASSSSGVSGGVASVGSQMAGNLSYMSDMADLKEQEFGSAMQYANAQQRIGEAQSVAQIGAALGSLGGYFGKK